MPEEARGERQQQDLGDPALDERELKDLEHAATFGTGAGRAIIVGLILRREVLRRVRGREPASPRPDSIPLSRRSWTTVSPTASRLAGESLSIVSVTACPG